MEMSTAADVAKPVFIVFMVISNLIRNWRLVILSGGVA